MLDDDPTAPATADDTPLVAETPAAPDDPKPESGDADAAPEGAGEGDAAGKPPQAPTAPEPPKELTSAQIQEAIQTPQGRQHVLESYRALSEQAKSEADAKADQERLEGLIARAEETGDFTEVGKTLTQRHRESARTATANKAAMEQVSQQFAGTVLPALMNDPEVKEIVAQLTDEEKREIDPNNPAFAGDDMTFYKTYLPKFRAVITRKSIELKAEELAKTRFEALKTAAANEATGNRVGEGSPDLPAAKPGTVPQGTARELISRGLDARNDTQGGD